MVWLRLVHIVAGTFWVGSVVFAALFLFPTARAVGKRNAAANTAEPTHTVPATICTKRSQTTSHLRWKTFDYTMCIVKLFPRRP